MNRRVMIRALCYSVLGAGACHLAGAVTQGSAVRTADHPVPRRLVVLDWGLTEMVLSLGVVPVAVANTPGFRRNYTTSELPDTVVDLGLMFQPNMELLLALKPDLILITPAHASIRPSLERLAPTLTLGHYRSSPTPYTAVCAETLSLAQVLNCTARALDLLTQADAQIAQAAITLANLSMPERDRAQKPIWLVRFIDESHVRVFGDASLFGELLSLLNLRNAWDDTPGFTASSSPTGPKPNRTPSSAVRDFDMLSSMPNATLVAFLPLPAAVIRMRTHSPVWQAMPFEHQGHSLSLPGIPPEGGILSGLYFVRTLLEALAS